MSVLRVLGAEPPLDPTGDEARSLLRRELVHPEYHERNILQQILDWVDRFVSDSINAASQAPPLSTFAAMVAFLVLAVGLVWLLSQVVAAAFVTPFTSSVTSLQYLDQRMRKEAYDVELMTKAGLTG